MPLSVTSVGVPIYLTRFVGREREVEDLRSRLDGPASLVTLVGVGGSGKTRLAAELARSLASGDAVDSRVAGGVSWVDLAVLADPARLTQAVGEALGLQPSGGLAVTDQLVRAINGRRTLVVLDNCEEFATHCHRLADLLLAACPHLVLLATSRVPLGSQHEVLVPMPPLESGSSFRGDQAARSEATELFYDRAGLLLPTYSALSVDTRAVNAVCRRLDGLPLAIELAAPWIRVLSATDLLSEIDRNLDVLSVSMTTLSGRHRSMRAVLDASWTWLSGDDREVLRGLGAFVGAFSRQAVEAVTGGTLASLASLAERSLLQRVPDADDATQYRMHELVRQYCVEMLDSVPHVADRVRERHFAYYLSIAEQAHRAWDGPLEVVWLDRLRVARPNIDAALAWGMDRRKSELVLRMLAAMVRVWEYSFPFTFYRTVLEDALTLPWNPASTIATSARARTLNAAGYAATGANDFNRAYECFGEAIELYERLGDGCEHAYSIRSYGVAKERAGDLGKAEQYFRHSMSIARRGGDAKGEVWSAYHLAEAKFAAGRFAEASEPLLAVSSRFEQLDIHIGTYYAQVVLGDNNRRLGRHSESLEAYSSALALQHRWHFTVHGAEVLDGLGVLAVDLGLPDRAAVMFGASEAWVDAFGRGNFDDAMLARSTAEDIACSEIGDERYSAGLDVGRSCDPQQAVDEARMLVQGLAKRCAAPLPSGLTGREVEVLGWVAWGLSNTDIAAKLAVSPRTIDAHLRSIFEKLDVKSRTAAAHEATRLGAIRPN